MVIGIQVVAKNFFHIGLSEVKLTWVMILRDGRRQVTKILKIGQESQKLLDKSELNSFQMQNGKNISCTTLRKDDVISQRCSEINTISCFSDLSLLL